MLPALLMRRFGGFQNLPGLWRMLGLMASSGGLEWPLFSPGKKL